MVKVPAGAVREITELAPGQIVYAVCALWGVDMHKWRIKAVSGGNLDIKRYKDDVVEDCQTTASAWNVGYRDSLYPKDFIFHNYWHAYAYVQRLKNARGQ